MVFESSVETYKNYLVGGLWSVKWFFGRIGFDMDKGLHNNSCCL